MYLHADVKMVITADELILALAQPGATLDRVLNSCGIWHMAGALLVVIHAPDLASAGAAGQPHEAGPLVRLQVVLTTQHTDIQLPELQVAGPNVKGYHIMASAPLHAHVDKWLKRHLQRGQLLLFKRGAMSGVQVAAQAHELRRNRPAQYHTAALMALRPFGRPVFFVATSAEPETPSELRDL